MLPQNEKTPWPLLILTGGSGALFLLSLWLWAMGS